MIRSSKGLLALSPLLVFLLVYVLSSLFVGDFGRVPVSSAFLIAAIWAVATTPGKLRERINCFSKGAGDRNILLMIWIFVLAGAFAGSAKDIGAIDATVAATNSTKVQGNPNTLANTAVTPSHLSCKKNYNRVHSV